MIGIMAQSEKYFASGFLAGAVNGHFFNLTQKVECDDLIIVGASALVRYYKMKRKKFNSVAVIFSDTNFCIHHKWCNEYVAEKKINVYAMPDLADYLTVPFIPAYQTITLPKIENITRSNEIIRICHSPGIKYKKNYKGSKQIANTIKKIKKKNRNIEFKIQTGLDWESCIKDKANAHIFIDQIVLGNPKIPQKRFGGEIRYCGALGKSGIESMLLGSCVITTMKPFNTSKYFPFPPVVLTDFNKFQNDITELIVNNDQRESLAKEQNEWAKKYCSPEFVANHITRHINEKF